MLSSVTFHLTFETGSCSLNLELNPLPLFFGAVTSPATPGIFNSLYLPELGLQVYTTMSGFYVGARDLNSGPQTCAASTSLIKLSLRFLLLFQF